MQKLVFINACIRGKDSRTLHIAEQLLAVLKKRYTVTEICLADSALRPVTAPLYRQRGEFGLPEEELRMGRAVAEADRIVIAAPFWDMSFPSVLKVFFEHISAPELTFLNNEDGTTSGNCKAEKLLYITTRGMEIPTESPLDQGTSYLKALAWLWGIGGVQTVAAWGMDVQEEGIVAARLEEAVAAGKKICEEF